MGLFPDFGLLSDDSSGLLDNLGLDTGISDYVPQVFDYFAGDQPAAQPVASVPMVRPPMGGGALPLIAAGSVSLSQRFPALYTFLMSQRQKGIPVSADKMWTMLKKFGPVFLTGLMGAQAINELMMYKATRKRRRMNSLNPKALSRATRRLCSFQNRSSKVMAALGGLAHRRTKRRGHCFKCKRSPCAC